MTNSQDTSSVMPNSSSAGKRNLRPWKRRALSAITKVHRWIGIFGCVSFVVWFISGAVLAYVHFPDMKTPEKMETLDPIRWDAVKVRPDEALKIAAFTEFPQQFWLEAASGEPIYRMQDWNDQFHAVSAVDGRRITGVTPEQALQTVQYNLNAPAATVKEAYLQSDQWTVTNYWDERRPFHLIELNDKKGTQYYVQIKTGEIVLDTIRSERLWNYVGAIPHWIYFPVIRHNTYMWTWVVCILAAIGTFSAITGIWIGLSKLRLRNRYGKGKVTPFTGWIKWHHITGLVGGVAVLLWIVTGFFSMYPGGFLEQRDITKAEYQRFAGSIVPTFPAGEFRPPESVASTARTAHFVWIGGSPFVVLDRNTDETSVYDVKNGQPVRLEDSTLFAAAEAMLPGNSVTMSKRLPTGDEYWHTGFTVKHVPILRVGFDDASETWFHIDPRSGELVGLLDDIGRIDRWWNWGIHDVDFAFLLRNRPLWDVVILTLLAAGLIISATSVVIGGKRLLFTAKASKRRRRAAAESRSRRRTLSDDGVAHSSNF